MSCPRLSHWMSYCPARNPCVVKAWETDPLAEKMSKQWRSRAPQKNSKKLSMVTHMSFWGLLFEKPVHEFMKDSISVTCFEASNHRRSSSPVDVSCSDSPEHPNKTKRSWPNLEQLLTNLNNKVKHKGGSSPTFIPPHMAVNTVTKRHIIVNEATTRPKTNEPHFWGQLRSPTQNKLRTLGVYWLHLFLSENGSLYIYISYIVYVYIMYRYIHCHRPWTPHMWNNIN